MSRSKRNRVLLFQDKSEKKDKKRFHKRFRREQREVIKAAHGDATELEDAVFPVEEEVSDVWSWRKDGKIRLRVGNGMLSRFFTAEWLTKLTRK